MYFPYTPLRYAGNENENNHPRTLKGRYTFPMSISGKPTTSSLFASGVQARLEHYRVRVGAVDLNTLTDSQRQHVFLWAVDDFQAEVLGLDELSALAHTLWRPPAATDVPKTIALNEAIDACAELSFYVRKAGANKQGAVTLTNFLSVMHAYYEQHRELL